MESPEIWDFKEPDHFFQIHEHAKIPLEKTKRFPFAHLVTVVLPDTSKVSSDLTEILSKDRDYYKILNFRPSEILKNGLFLNNFVRNGELGLLSVGTRIDCDNCLAITPTGVLTLVLTKRTYQEVGLQGRVSHFTKKLGDPYIVCIDLKDGALVSGKSNYKKLQTVLDRFPSFDVIVSWCPPDDEICPSSVAKFLVDRGYKVKLCTPKFGRHVTVSNQTPLIKPLDERKENGVLEFVEWLGMVSLEADLDGDVESYINTYECPEPNVDAGLTQVLQWRGLFLPRHVETLLVALQNLNSTNPKLWVTLYVQGFSDSPVGWNYEEQQHFISGDSGYLMTFCDLKCLLCTFGCSKKRLK
ncbi:ribonuclease P protein subunit p40-like [Cylas formicarius]|uniref:ribonuclease P protein subunit p40-like n=1 Tax=Cylas formicarius TaxID=197179 RepID=UPI002958BD41|nr:ribonuclease P protein subunit p40-like [Cylas formicarius]